MPLMNLKRFFYGAAFTIYLLMLGVTCPVMSQDNPNIPPETTSKKPTWEDATILMVTQSEYTAGLSSVSRRSERVSIASKTFVYLVESRMAWARNKPTHLAAGSHVQVKYENGQFLLKTPAGATYPMVVIQQDRKS